MLTLPLEGVNSLLEIKEMRHSLFYCRGEKGLGCEKASDPHGSPIIYIFRNRLVVHTWH